MDAFRGAAVDHRRDAKVERVYSLPLSLGVCGILSYVETRPAARQACQHSAQRVLQGMHAPHVVVPPPVALPTADDEAAAAVAPTQRALTRRVWDVAIPPFLESLSADERVSFFDNGSKCGTAWLHALPCGSGYRSLTNHQVAGALNVRTLQPDLPRRPLCARCGRHNGVLHFESCGAADLPRQYRHNHIRDSLVKALKAQHRYVEAEPPINLTMHAQRADIRVGAAGGVQALDAVYGLVDIKVKAVLAADTTATRAAATVAPAAEGEEPRPHHKLAWAQIAASLNTVAQATRTHYAPLGAVQPVFPLVMSSGGTFHLEAFQCLHALFPQARDRLQVITDISVALVRARSQVYHLA